MSKLRATREASAARNAKASAAPPPKSEAPRAGGRKPARGVIWVIVVLMGSSGLIRLGAGVSKAFALASEPGAHGEAAASCDDPGTQALLEALREREKKLDAREAELQDRAQSIKLAETQVEERIASLVEAEQNLAATIQMADKAAEKDVDRLVTLYENMKPKEAAQLFEEMAPEFAAGFLSRMRPDAAAAILSKVSPQNGYAISVLMAGRNANAPKN